MRNGDDSKNASCFHEITSFRCIWLPFEEACMRRALSRTFSSLTEFASYEQLCVFYLQYPTKSLALLVKQRCAEVSGYFTMTIVRSNFVQKTNLPCPHVPNPAARCLRGHQFPVPLKRPADDFQDTFWTTLASNWQQ